MIMVSAGLVMVAAAPVHPGAARTPRPGVREARIDGQGRVELGAEVARVEVAMAAMEATVPEQPMDSTAPAGLNLKIARTSTEVYSGGLQRFIQVLRSHF